MTTKTTIEAPIPGNSSSRSRQLPVTSLTRHVTPQLMTRHSVSELATATRITPRDTVTISTYNVRSLKIKSQPNNKGKLHQLISGCIENNIDLVAVQEHRHCAPPSQWLRTMNTLTMRHGVSSTAQQMTRAVAE
jgi:hypothetical protein